MFENTLVSVSVHGFAYLFILRVYVHMRRRREWLLTKVLETLVTPSLPVPHALMFRDCYVVHVLCYIANCEM